MSEYEYNGSLMKAAIAHHKDAGEAVDDLPDRDDDQEEHDKCVRSFHAHVKAMDDYCEEYRRAVGMDSHDEDEGDPQAGSTEEKRRQRARVRQLRSQIGRA
jgi:hypothetical protein